MADDRLAAATVPGVCRQGRLGHFGASSFSFCRSLRKAIQHFTCSIATRNTVHMHSTLRHSSTLVRAYITPPSLSVILGVAGRQEGRERCIDMSRHHLL